MESRPDGNAAPDPSAPSQPVNGEQSAARPTLDLPSPSRTILPDTPGTTPTSRSKRSSPAADAQHVGSLLPRITGYLVAERIGKGGMGSVWRATQLSTRQPVALKLMDAMTFSSQRARQRFEREVELAARLNHPFVARVYDSGLASGVYFYAMELVDGLPLDKYVEKKKLSRHEIVQLMLRVCQAVQHAHQKGIIHRDLKPSNILVTAEGQPRVLDFGLAKSLLHDEPAPVVDSQIAEKPLRTDDTGSRSRPSANAPVSVDGEIAGTPAFMSPDQAAGRSVDTRSDVYSLGVILYRLLTGKSPHELSGTDHEIMRRVREEQPIRPRKADPHIDGDLEALLLKALAREPERRYPSAAELAVDLQNYLDGEPLAARAPSTIYFLQKRVRKYWVAVTLIGVVIAAGIGAIAYDRVQKSERQTEQNRLQKEHIVQLEASERVSQLRLRDYLIQRATSAAAEGRIGSADGFLDAADRINRKYREPQLLTHVNEWHRNEMAPLPMLSFAAHEGETSFVYLTADAHRVISAGTDGAARVWDVRTGELLQECRPAGIAPAIRGAAVSLDERWVATAGDDGVVRIWDIGDAGRRTAPASAPSAAPYATLDVRRDGRRIWSIAWSRTAPEDDGSKPNGRLLTGHDDGSITLWDAATGKPIRTTLMHQGPVTCVAFHGNLGHGISLGADQRLVRWLLSGGEVVPMGYPVRQGCTRFAYSGAGESPDASIEGRGQVLMETIGRVFGVIDNRPKQYTSLADKEYSPSSCFILSAEATQAVVGHEDGRLKFWDVQKQRCLRVYAGHAGKVTCAVMMSPGTEGRRLISGGADGSIKVWDLGDTNEREVRNIEESSNWKARHFTFNSTGDLALAVDDEGEVKLLDVPTSRVIRTLHETHGVAGFADDAVRVFIPPRATRQKRSTQPATAPADAPLTATLPLISNSLDAPTPRGAMTADGKLAVCVTEDGYLEVWDAVAPLTPSSQPLRRFGGNGRIRSFALSVNGSIALVGSQDGTMRAWDISSASTSAIVIPAHTGAVTAVAVSADGTWALSGGEDGQLKRWRLEKNAKALRLNYSFGQVASIALHPTGRFALVASLGNKQTYVLGLKEEPAVDDPDAATELIILPPHLSQISCVAFAPYSDRLVALTCDIGAHLRVSDLSRPAAYRAAANRMLSAAGSIGNALPDRMALAQWYATRGLSDWAADLLTPAPGTPATAAGSSLLAETMLRRSTKPSAGDVQRIRNALATQPPSARVNYLLEAAGGGMSIPMQLNSADRVAAWPATRPGNVPALPPNAVRTDLLAELRQSAATRPIAAGWSFESSPGGGLVSSGGVRADLDLRHAPARQYQITIDFSRRSGTDGWGINLVKPDAVGGVAFQWQVGTWQNSVIGMQFVDGLKSLANRTTQRHPHWFEQGKRYQAIVRIDASGVKTYIDGQLIYRFDTTTFAEFLGGEKELPKSLQLTTFSAEHVFHRVEIAEWGGQPPPPPPPTKSWPPPPPAPIVGQDLIPLTDESAKLGGKWQVENGAVTVTEKGKAALELPVTPPASYDLIVDFIAPENGIVTMYLVGPAAPFKWVMSSKKDEGCCFELFKGLAMGNLKRDNPLKAGERYVARVSVRPGAVQAFINDKLVKAARPNELSPQPDRMLSRPDRIGIGKFAPGGVTFTKVRLVTDPRQLAQIQPAAPATQPVK